jgi:hypothetical protein
MYATVRKFSESQDTNIVVDVHLLKSPGRFIEFCDETGVANVRMAVNDDPDKVTISITNTGIFIERKWTERRVQQNYNVQSDDPRDKRVESALDLAFDMTVNGQYYISDVTLMYGDVLDDDNYPSSTYSGKTKLKKCRMTKDYVLRWLDHVLKLGKY